METNIKAKNLRKGSTELENKLWYYLRNRNFHNLKFRRQFPIENYIVDFICLEKRLVIEVDGSQHNFEKNIERDLKRDNIIKENNFKVLRFWNNDINKNMNGVLELIAKECGF